MLPKLALHWWILIGLVVGAVGGVSLNWAAGTYGTAEQPAEVVLAERGLTLRVFDSPSRTRVVIERPEQPTQTYIIDGTLSPARRRELREQPETQVFASLSEFAKEAPGAYQLFENYGMSTARWIGETARALGGLFLRMLQMVSIPLIITSLLTGVLGLGAAERLGRMFGRTLLYYVSTSLLAIVTGLLIVNLIQPGLRSDLQVGGPEETVGVLETAEEQSLGDVLFEQLLRLIPSNPIEALSDGNFLSIISFTLAFGIFTLLVGGESLRVIRELAESAFAVMMKMTMAIIYLAPVGVLFLMLAATATQGVEVFGSLAWYMLSVLVALVVHAGITLPLIVWLIARRSPWQYAKALSPALLTAFSSASSNATLPLTLNCVEERAGVSNRVSSFVLPLGATVNMDGTALYEAVAVLFIAQMVTPDPLTFSQQVIVAFTALLASIGAAGIPHAGLVMMTIILQAVGLPLEAQGLIIAVDRVLDMARTSVNVWSDSCGCAVIARFEDLENGDLAAAAEPSPASEPTASESKPATSSENGPVEATEPTADSAPAAGG